MNKEHIYLSSIAPDAADMAREFGLGLEIAEYCTAWNMDEKFGEVDPAVRKKLDGISRSTLHGPYNELFPCAIDRKARALTAERYRQAIDLAKAYGSSKVIIHGGYNPWIYYPVWYVEQSIVFWKEFMKTDPGVEICLENVLETEPQWLLDIVRAVDDPRLRLCLDVGHASAYSRIPLMTWLESWAPYINHFHIHNNAGLGTDGTADQHRPLNEGAIPMKQLLRRIDELCPEATVTLEMMEMRSSLEWIQENHIWNF